MVTFNHHKTAKLDSLTKQSEVVQGRNNIYNNSDNNIKYLTKLADHSVPLVIQLHSFFERSALEKGRRFSDNSKRNSN